LSKNNNAAADTLYTKLGLSGSAGAVLAGKFLIGG
jgi:hypothetical protein